MLLEYVLKHPEGVTRDQITSYVYHDDPNGGPPSSSIVSVMVSKINQQLEENGLPERIRGSGGPGSIYKVVRR